MIAMANKKSEYGELMNVSTRLMNVSTRLMNVLTKLTSDLTVLKMVKIIFWENCRSCSWKIQWVCTALTAWKNG